MASSIPGQFMPTDRVANFQNQQLPALVDQGRMVSGGTSGAQTSLITPPSEVATKLGDIQRQIGEGNTRLATLSTIGAQKRLTLRKEREREEAERAALSHYTGVGGAGNIGMAWNPDGSLSASRNKALTLASSALGSRYVPGKAGDGGFDCGGLVMWVYGQLGYSLNRGFGGVTMGQQMNGVRTNVANLRPGDLVCWKDGSHIAIYAGNGEMIEAANPRVGVVRRKIWADPSAIYGVSIRLPGE